MAYDQTKDKYLKNACTLVTLLNIIKYKYWITVMPGFIMQVAIFFDKLSKWFPKWWASFDVIYPSFIRQLNKKLWLQFELQKWYITSIRGDDTGTYWIWVPKYNRSWYTPEDKWEMTKEDVDNILKYTWKWYWHNLAWDWSSWWYIINTMWKKPFSCSLEILRYMESKWLIWKPVRSITIWNKYTQDVVDVTIKLRKAELKWRLYEYIAMNKWSDIFEKWKELYFYWRS